jgi:hypothetical protein
VTVLAPDLRPAPAPQREAGPFLQTVPGALRRRSGAPFTVLVFGLLLGGMIGYLMLQTTLQEQAFKLNDLRSEAEVLSARQSYLEAGLALRTTPQELARAAQDLGMVANPYATFIDLATGAVTGVGQPAAGTEFPRLEIPATTTTTATATTAEAAPAVADPATAEADAAAEGVAEDEVTTDAAAVGEAPADEGEAPADEGATDAGEAAEEAPVDEPVTDVAAAEAAEGAE